MAKRRSLQPDEIAEYLRDCPDEACDLALELRDIVREVAPEAIEAIKFNSLCYYKADHPYGAIGGNICAISVHHERLYLGFIHGAFLPDPAGLLEGNAKAKRQLEIHSAADVRNPAVRELIQAAVAYSPAAEDEHL